MSFNGSGVFQINTTGQPVVTNTTITSTAFNALTADLAVGLTTCMTKDGQSTPTANIPMGGYKLTGLAQGASAGDAVAYPAPSASVIGTTTNDNAATGYVGEYLESEVLQASAVSLSSGDPPINITSISLTAGDWDVSGTVSFVPAASTSVTQYVATVNSTSATLPTASGKGAYSIRSMAAQVPNAADYVPTGNRRVSIASTTTFYLIARSTFTVSTMQAFGIITARRAR